MIPISETFISPNGEGIKTGLMTLFIRVAGCDYAMQGHSCSYCDTSYAWHPENGKEFTVEQIIEQVEPVLLRIRIREICLTGGEPLAYSPEINSLIHYLGKRYQLSVETNGGHLIWKEDCSWSLDIKCPSSGNSEYNIYDNLSLLTHKDQAKFVIGTRDDFNFARDLVKSRVVLTNVIFQPSYKLLSHAKLIDWIKKDRNIAGVVRVGTQCHKVWYPRKKRGV